VENPDGVEHAVREVTVDGQTILGRTIPLVDDGRTHEVKVVLGAAT
jgi:hypothetical protein